MPPQKTPYIVEAADHSTTRPATFIFLHGYGDDAEGLPLGLAQQFQMYSKLPYVRWVLPHAPFSREAMTNAWYLLKSLPNAQKPRVPGDEDEADSADGVEGDDEEGILESVKYVDELVTAEIARGVEGGRVVVGGFSQGCAVSLVWGLVGQKRGSVAGVVGLSGYLPLAERVEGLRKEARREEEEERVKTKREREFQWFYVHGTKDVIVPRRLFEKGKENLKRFGVNEEDVEGHLYEGMSHSTSPAELRDLLGWFERVVPP